MRRGLDRLFSHKGKFIELLRVLSVAVDEGN